jgi:hypothetical protein
MLPVPFVGNMRYDAIFIVTYVAWILFEVVTGKSRKTLDPKEGAGPRLIFLSGGDDLGGNFPGFYVLLWGAAGGDPVDADGIIFSGDCVDVAGYGIPLLLHARFGALLHV